MDFLKPSTRKIRGHTRLLPSQTRRSPLPIVLRSHVDSSPTSNAVELIAMAVELVSDRSSARVVTPIFDPTSQCARGSWRMYAIRPYPHRLGHRSDRAPISAANTYVITPGFDQAASDVATFDATPRVMQEGPNNQDDFTALSKYRSTSFGLTFSRWHRFSPAFRTARLSEGFSHRGKSAFGRGCGSAHNTLVTRPARCTLFYAIRQNNRSN